MKDIKLLTDSALQGITGGDLAIYTRPKGGKTIAEFFIEDPGDFSDATGQLKGLHMAAKNGKINESFLS